MGDAPPESIITPAYVVHRPQQDFTLEDIVLSPPFDNEILIEMKYSGICHTDIACQQGEFGAGNLPAVFGHEGAGYIRSISTAVAQRRGLAIGDFVLLSLSFCEKCRYCERGYPADCDEGRHLRFSGLREDGTTSAQILRSSQPVHMRFFGQSSFSKFSLVHETCVVKHDYPSEDASIFAAMGCGFQSGIGTVLNVLIPPSDSSIVIFGLGTVGLTALMGAKYLNVNQIIAVDLLDTRLSMAKELGASVAFNSRDTDIVTRIMDLTDGCGVDFAIDCTGAPKVIEPMLDCLAVQGTAVTVGVPPADAKIRISPMRFLAGSRRYLGCREGDSVPAQFIPKLMELQRQGHFPVEKLVKVYKYRDLAQALDDMRNGSVVKPVIQWS
ncbi:hypothetical protein M409DRAFT_66076 [Zasmidium cellare ATCC 36951]|uniref:Enoyl reductase (ER) domain-containing protein n=1 Tax=Zasmidium cellare ATCC 36951 TaxID=1080233 RepID=A0A6A6CK81_ZASCE|nr:uncharacterized protein M409DRAFT_66076 [Zasmidium cellare ATCC 36951]KAF2167565.1 hypothetical protein M409DRAFT_66076 [Zasmidium cellare ATCC 36951]